MRKTLLALSLVIFFFSCKKSDNNISQPQPEAKKYDVTFTTGFATTVTNFSVGRKTTNGLNQLVAGNIDNLYYRVYNSSGTLVNSIDQASTATGFGTITDQLPAGTYNVFIGGSKGILSFNADQFIKFSNANFTPAAPVWNEVFFNQFPVTVGTSTVSQAVSLNRLVGAVDVTLTDAIPNNSKKITLVFTNYGDMIALSCDRFLSTVSKTVDYTLGASDAGVKNKVLSLFAATTSATAATTTDLTIRAYDNSNVVIAEKTITNVPVYRNKRTAISGALFGTGTSNQNAGFTVTVNTDWGTPPTPITF